MRRFLGLLLVATAAVASATIALAGQSPKAVRASILAAARAQTSVHWSSADIYGGLAFTTAADVTKTAGKQRVTFQVGKKSAHIQIVVTGGTAYVRGDALGLELNLGLKQAQATTYAGKWIAIPKSDKAYAPTASGDTLDSLVQAMSPRGRLSVVSATVHGVRVIGVRGVSGTGKKKMATVLVAHAKGKPLPLEVDTVVPGKNLIDRTTLRKWNEHVTVTAPSTSTPIATVRGS